MLLEKVPSCGLIIQDRQMIKRNFGSILKKWTQIYTNCYNKSDTKGGKYHGRRQKESVR